MMKKLFMLSGILLASFISNIHAQGYDILIDIEEYQDTIMYLGYYYGDKLSVADTTTVNKGKMVFRGDEKLKQGVYFLVSGDKKKLIEFLVGNDQEFSLNTKVSGMPDDMQVKGSDENKLFYQYLSNNKKSYDKIKSYRQKISELDKGNDSIQLLNEMIDSISRESIKYKEYLMEEYPQSMTALLFRVMKEPEMPEIFPGGGRQDTLDAYLYYRKHYWDDIDFSDDRVLRTPVFQRKLDRYMDNIIPKNPDSVIVEIDNIINKTGVNSEMKEYLLWYFTNKYESSNIMGYDRIFVHMVDKYFTGTTYDWLHPTVQENMLNRVNKIRNVLLDEIAPSLVMADTNKQFIALHQITAEYMIVLFWVSTCGECKREVKTLRDFYNKGEFDLEVYAVNTDTTLSKWTDYIIKNELKWINVNGNTNLTGDYHDLYDIYSTPVIFLLDDQKRIIAKRLSAEKIPAFIRRHKENKKQ